MIRNYLDNSSIENVSFFVGQEIEKTPAYGMTTLFVVGVQDVQNILELANQNKCTHIYFGANQSFPNLKLDDIAQWAGWESMIVGCLKENFWCTLDFDVAQHEGLLDSGLIEYRRFIPQISVKLPYLNQLGYNTTIKIDDKGFEASNPGVWCIPVGAITQRKYFTNWDEYGKDVIIK